MVQAWRTKSSWKSFFHAF